MKLTMSSDGYISVAQLLQHSQFRGYTVPQLEECVETCPKQRFELKTTAEGEKFVRATQGHSISAVEDLELLEQIKDASSVPVCLHGTYAERIPSILRNGLSRMARNHIHLIACQPGEEGGVVSGMRGSADTIVTIDVAGAMAAGVLFFRSSNGVILSPGMGDSGIIPAHFIGEVVDRAPPHPLGQQKQKKKQKHKLQGSSCGGTARGGQRDMRLAE